MSEDKPEEVRISKIYIKPSNKPNNPGHANKLTNIANSNQEPHNGIEEGPPVEEIRVSFYQRKPKKYTKDRKNESVAPSFGDFESLQKYLQTLDLNEKNRSEETRKSIRQSFRQQTDLENHGLTPEDQEFVLQRTALIQEESHLHNFLNEKGEAILLNGYMEMKTAQSRMEHLFFFELKDEFLNYYYTSDDTNQKPLGYFDLNSAKSVSNLPTLFVL